MPDNASDQARARLAALEADPKHAHSPEGAAQSRVDRLDDPAHQKPASLDPGWHKDGDNWTHPDLEEN
jgi:hypothetical protein